MKRWAPTLVVLALLAGLGAWVLRNETKPKDEGPAKVHLWQLDAAAVTKIELTDLGTGLVIALGRESGTWWIESPARYESDGDAMEALVRNLADPEIERKLDLPADLGPYGLAEPRFKAVVTLADKKTHTLLVGLKNPTDTGYFVREEGAKAMYTAAAYAVDAFRKSVGELRSKSLMALDPAAVTKLTLRRHKGGNTLTFVRAGPDAWTLQAPFTAAADKFAVDGILADLKGLKGTDILDDKYAYSRFKLDQPDAEVVVWTGSGAGQTLTLAKPDKKKEDLYASSTRLPFTAKLAGSFLLTSVLKPVEEYRERLLLSASREDLTECEIDQGALKLVCRKGPDGKWAVAEPKGLGASAETELSDMLFEVVYLRVEKFVNDHPKGYAAYGLQPPRIAVRVAGVKDKVPFTARYTLGSRAGDLVHLRFGDAPNVYGVRKDVLEKVERFADKVRAGGKPAAAAPAAPAPAAPAKPAPAKKR